MTPPPQQPTEPPMPDQPPPPRQEPPALTAEQLDYLAEMFEGDDGTLSLGCGHHAFGYVRRAVDEIRRHRAAAAEGTATEQPPALTTVARQIDPLKEVSYYFEVAARVLEDAALHPNGLTVVEGVVQRHLGRAGEYLTQVKKEVADLRRAAAAEGTAPAPRCNCWLGQPGAMGGDSRVREKCPVHGEGTAPAAGSKPPDDWAARDTTGGGDATEAR